MTALCNWHYISFVLSLYVKRNSLELSKTVVPAPFDLILKLVAAHKGYVAQAWTNGVDENPAVV